MSRFYDLWKMRVVWCCFKFETNNKALLSEKDSEPTQVIILLSTSLFFEIMKNPTIESWWNLLSYHVDIMFIKISPYRDTSHYEVIQKNYPNQWLWKYKYIYMIYIS